MARPVPGRLFLLCAALLSLLLLGLAIDAQEQTIGVGQTLTSQRFEWQAAFANRPDGTYGQYRVTLNAGTTYEIKTSSPSGGNTIDPYVYLLDESFAIVAFDDDSAGALQSKITYTPAKTETYSIRLRAFARNTLGFVSLTLTGQPPPPPALPGIVIAPGDTLNAQSFAWESTFVDRVDGAYATYTIDLTAGTPYNFTTSNAGGGNTTDTYLYLLNAGGAVVAFDDDSNGNFASRIIYQPTVTGTYTVKLRAYARGTGASCTLKVTAPTQGTGNPRRPDLIIWPQYLRQVYISEAGPKLLRLSNAAANIGRGPLELYAVVQPDGTTVAYQRTYNENNTFTDNLAGTFIFDGHQDHNHWHFADFATYNLRLVTDNGGVGAIVRTSQKVTFCLADVIRYDPAAGPSNYTCGNQGISVGWSDVYDATLSGQDIDITGIDDGTYWLESVADPVNRIRETNNANNAARIQIQINGSSVAVLP